MTTGAEIGRSDEIYWIALRLVPGLGTKKTIQLIEQYASVQGVFRAPADELESLGLSPAVAQTIASGCTFDEAATQQQRMAASGARLIALEDPQYSRRLRTIYDPPPVLFVRGNTTLLNTLSISVVGTRRASAYGTAATDRLSRDLALSGLTIVSGMARGIDTAAHRAALDLTGNTVAVLGSGVDVVYPAENRKLAEDIAAKGLLVSEFPMGTPGYPQNFPVRNRVVSGLSAGVLVVEGAQYSGSAITARLAIEQGRELFAVPGNITNRLSWAPNMLIKDGAKLVQSAQDILDELSSAEKERLFPERPPPDPRQAVLAPELDTPVTRDVLHALLPDGCQRMDDLLESVPQHSASEILAALFELELLGLARQLPGGRYQRVW